MSATHPSVRPATAPSTGSSRLGLWRGGHVELAGEQALLEALRDVRRAVWIVRTPEGPALADGGTVSTETLTRGSADTTDLLPVAAVAPPLHPQDLGDPGFRADLGLRYAYVAGAMANGIGSTAIVEAMGRAGMVGFFGAAGLALDEVSAAIDRLQAGLPDGPYGFNLIHSPAEPALEAAVAELYIRRGVRLVSASAYLGLTLPLVRYRTHGIHRDAEGRVVAPNHVLGKVSRVEVASKFLAPPPDEMLAELVRSGDLTEDQAEMARTIPVAQDLIAEADSGGHTDNRPALALLPTLLALRDRLATEHGYAMSLRVGAAGGIATPDSAAAAFAMGAAFVLTGSVNQACVEAGTSDVVRQMLAAAQQADVCMAPAADMFEMGVKVQVLKRGTMFAMRAQKLFEIYRSRASLDELSAAERDQLERMIFRQDLASVWRDTEAFFAERDPRQLERAATDPKHRMALVFRSYLGQSSTWANRGDASRRIDYQIWCGPSMGAFNEWVRGTFLEQPANRDVATVALNLMHGAAVRTRAATLRAQGVRVPTTSEPPRRRADLEERLA